MAKPRDESFFARLTRLFRSGPALRRKIKGYDDTDYYDKKAILANTHGGAGMMMPIRKGGGQLALLGASDMMSRMTRYAEVAEMEYCLSGETRIAGPSGFKTIEELSREHGLDGEFIVYSYDHNEKKIVPAIGKAARKTKTDHAWKVTFDNGKEIIGTADHRLLLRDGTYKVIGELKPGDAMMPFLRRNVKQHDYPLIYTMDKSRSKSGWVSEHRLIAEWVAGRMLKEDEVVHHKNFIKDDNRPENLEIMNEDDHISLHAVLMNGPKWDREKNADWIAKFKERHSAWMKANNPSERKDITFDRILGWCDVHGFNSKALSRALDTDQNTIKRKLRTKGFADFQTFAKTYDPEWKNNGSFQRGQPSSRRKAVEFASICSAYQPGVNLVDLAVTLGVSPGVLVGRVKEQGYKSWGDFTSTYQNCKVVSVEYHGVIDLYDLTVDGYKNFATDSVISHNTPICSKAMDIIADEACSGDENGKNFHVYSDNPQIKRALEELFYDVLNVDFELRVWVRNLVKYGDVFLYNEVAPGVGVINARSLPVNEVVRDEEFDREDPYAVRFIWEKYGKKYLENWQVTHFRIMGNDLFFPYGTSMLESARRIWRQYVMMVDAMLVYRLVRSPERRVFYIDVGTVAPNDIPNYMTNVMATIRGNMAVDKETGRMDERYNPVSVDEDYVIPVRGANSGTKIDTLAGGQHVTATEDVELLQNQLFAALGVPKAYLGYDEMLSSKATLAQEDIRFSRTIQILQKIVISELNKLAILHLYALGFDGEDLIDFELRMSNPSTIALQQKLDLWKTKIDIIAAVDQIETRFLPMDWLYKEILGFTDDETKFLREKLKEDKRFAAELDAITSPEPTGENTVDPWDSAQYGLPGGMPVQDTSNSLPSPDEGLPSQLSIDSDNSPETTSPMGTDELPIKDNPQVSKDKRNQSRRISDLSTAAKAPDFRTMLKPKNRSLRDLYDTEFLKNPLGEEIEKALNKTTGKEAYLSREVVSILERFNRFKKNQELPVDVHLIKEGEKGSQDSEFLDQIEVGEEEGEEGLPTFSELSELGLDLLHETPEKEPESPPAPGTGEETET